jgi:hypothetical protein
VDLLVAIYKFYSTDLKSVASRFRFTLRDMGPFMNFDFVSCFFLITITELSLNFKEELSLLKLVYFERATHKRTISPFKLYLYLKPLYSSLGGSTTLAEPFTKNDIFEDLR